MPPPWAPARHPFITHALCPRLPLLPQQALNVGAPEVAQKALRHASEFGLSHDSYKEFHPLMIYYSKQARLPVWPAPLCACGGRGALEARG